jgi:hypothetical protein
VIETFYYEEKKKEGEGEKEKVFFLGREGRIYRFIY